MATLLEKLQLAVAEPGFTRRRFLDRTVKVSAAVTAAAAGLAGPSSIAAKACTPIGSYACCWLEYCTWCGSSCNCSCTGSCHYSWTCVDSVSCQVWTCNECNGCSCSYAHKVCNCC